MNSEAENAPSAPVIYIVDDDDAVRFALSLLVETCGWKSRAFKSADEFKAAYRENGEVSCLVLDLNMPGLTGADLLESLESRIPVIVVTGNSDSLLAERARRAGVRAILSKPFSDQVLLGHIREALLAAA